ncbi:hypothetical protein GCM10009663_23810 [Kitasatospora arboriphila]|uniref:DUF4395 domain-containing protein n=2 Tax=Kitasatospora arboriphila TaxID=258052 RepID=A0ABN1TFD2_9ACTN
MADTMSSGDDTGERNPFAPPPADAPDRPWQPRAPQQPPTERPEDGDRDDDRVPPPHPWSPGYRGGWSEPQQPRFDPTDPVQRRARYALSAGMAGLFCAITGMRYLALLLGALALYWGISALRAERPASAASPAPHAAAGGNPHALGTARVGGSAQPQPTRPQVPAALGGLLTGGVALIFTLSVFGVQLYYHDYVTCVNDALTNEAAQSCNNLAPDVITQLTNPGSR